MIAYQIVVGGEIVHICSQPRYIKVNPETGVYVEASAEEAQGIAVNGTPYNVHGSEAIKVMVDGVETIAPVAEAKQIDTCETIFEYMQKNKVLEEKNQALEEQSEMLTECILEMSEIVYGE